MENQVVRPPLSHLMQAQWKLGVQVARAIGPQALYLTLLGFAIPLVFFDWAFSIKSTDYIENFSALASLPATATIYEFLIPASQFVSLYALGLILTVMVGLVAFFAIIHLALSFIRTGRVLSAKESFTRGFKTFLPRGLLLFVLVSLVVLISQPFILISFFIALMAFFVPSYHVVSGDKALPSIWNMMTLRFVPPTTIGRFGAFYLLSILGMFLVVIMRVLATIEQSLLNLGSHVDLPQFFVEPLGEGGLLSWAYMSQSVTVALLEAGTLGAFAIFSTAFIYYLINYKDPQRV